MSIPRRGCLSLGPLALILLVSSPPATADLALGPEELVQSGGADIDVPGYSVPSFVAWDGDGLRDLVVGEGGGGYPEGKVRVYRNTGTASAPEFSGYTYVQSVGADLISPGSG